MIHSKEIRLRQRPEGMPTAADFEVASIELAELAEGEFLIRNLWMSVDPYMRSRMYDRESYVPAFELGRPLTGDAVGQVVSSRHPDFKEADLVIHFAGWREYAISKGAGVRALPATDLPPQLHLGLFGTTGLTAYFGLLTVAELKPQETVFVSAAAGAVGSAVCQIARLKDSMVIGSCGNNQKAAWLRDEIGVQHVFNYRESPDLGRELSQSAPDGIDVYFENVGGDHLEAALSNMRPFGRIAVCGMIQDYNNLEAGGRVANLFEIIARRLTVRGFLLGDYADRFDEARRDLESWYRAGKLKSYDTVLEGIEKAPEAFIGLFEGKNTGKMLVRLSG